MNLVQNAVRHTHNGDTITLGSQSEMNVLYLGARHWRRDCTGRPKRIFERFVRATNCDYQFEGAGLGLSIVQAIAQAHGGWVELFSRLGHGSTFTIVIP